MATQASGGRWLPLLIAGLVRLCSATWRVVREDQGTLDQALADGPAVFAFWHGQQLPLIATHRGLGLVGLVSLSRDGALLAAVLQRLGFQVARGSSSRGGARALRDCLAALGAGRSPALAVDGPRGPRHTVRIGAAALAAATGAPIICCVAECWPVLRLRSWDRFEIPLPGARVRLRYRRVPPPAGADRASLAESARQISAALAPLSDPKTRPAAP